DAGGDVHRGAGLHVPRGAERARLRLAERLHIVRSLPGRGARPHARGRDWAHRIALRWAPLFQRAVTTVTTPLPSCPSSTITNAVSRSRSAPTRRARPISEERRASAS